MTLEDAKRKIDLMHESVRSHPLFKEKAPGHLAADMTWKKAKEILAKVNSPEPDEEGRAVLWLARHGHPVVYKANCWMQPVPMSANWCRFDPVAEAKKLGWGG